jgi:hypothetical protein
MAASVGANPAWPGPVEARLRALERVNPGLGVALRRLGAAVGRAAALAAGPADGVNLGGREVHVLHDAHQLGDGDRNGNFGVDPAPRRSLIDAEKLAGGGLGQTKPAQGLLELRACHTDSLTDTKRKL